MRQVPDKRGPAAHAFAVMAFVLLASCRSTADFDESPEGMRWIPGQTLHMGSEEPWAFPEEGPVEVVPVDGFWIDTHEVTNREFARFVEATGYVTTSEQPLPDAWFDSNWPADAPPPTAELRQPGSPVFVQPDPAAGQSGRWTYQHGASWRHPEGPGSNLVGRADHPIVQVSWQDAQAYAAWAGKALPTEAEWELAARGGGVGARYVWGDEHPSDASAPLLNMWQGSFPGRNLGTDGFLATAPVGSFPPSGFGLYDMAGNVWEWCANPFIPRTAAPTSDDGSDTQTARALRGGSFLCSDDYCTRYRPSARISSTPDHASNHIGFRCVLRTSPKDPAGKSDG